MKERETHYVLNVRIVWLEPLGEMVSSQMTCILAIHRARQRDGLNNVKTKVPNMYLLQNYQI
uniref:Uncharacterized protein n=1 Tax=Rhizophora mucronata TaxID=61149 RepID=A0A2P2QSS8_RHIMU